MSAPKIITATEDVGEYVVTGAQKLATEVFELSVAHAGGDTSKGMTYAIGTVSSALVMLAKTVGPDMTLDHVKQYLTELWAVLVPDANSDELFGNLGTWGAVTRGDA